MKVLLYNTSIITSEGVFECRTTDLKTAKNIVNSADEIESAIGHQATADILSQLLERPVEVNRSANEQSRDEIALVFKLNGRIEEGKILTSADIDQIGYKLMILEKKSD